MKKELGYLYFTMIMYDINIKYCKVYLKKRYVGKDKYNDLINPDDFPNDTYYSYTRDADLKILRYWRYD